MPAAMSTHKSFEKVFEPKHPQWLQQTTTGFHKSELQRDRLHYQPTVPKVLRGEQTLSHLAERCTLSHPVSGGSIPAYPQKGVTYVFTCICAGHLVVAEGEERRCENEDEHDR